jgi:tetratricopeptide (TPR) repeat protein
MWVLLSLILFSCGAKKKASNAESHAQNKPNLVGSPSSADLIYKNNFYEALRLKTVGDEEESQKILEWCLKQRPNDDAVLYLLASYAESSRRLSKARDYIKRASEIDPNNIWYVELLSKIQLETDDFTGAENSFRRLLAHDRYNKEWLYYFSETLILNRKYAEAIDIISRLIDETGPVPELVHQRNELLIELKRDQEMLAIMNKIMLDYPDMPEFTTMLLSYYRSNKKLDEAEKLFFSILSQNANHTGARIALAELYMLQGSNNKALDQLKIAFESGTLAVENCVQILIKLMEQQREPDQKVLELAIILREKNPTHFMSHALVGEIYKQLGMKKEALASFEKSLELNLDNYNLWEEVIESKYSMKRYAEALKTAEEALGLFPNQPQLYYYAGMSAMHLKNFTEALNFLEMGKDNVVRDASFKAQFELAMAEVFFNQNNLPKARKHLESADYLAPNDKLILNNRAFLLAKFGVDLDKALSLILVAIKGNENDALFLDTQAWVHFARKEYSEALEYIKKAYNADPRNAEINEHYGDILFKVNRMDEAVSYWLKARELGDESPELMKKIQTKRLEN